MASRRMFSFRLTESTRFIKMPPSTQNLYFHLGMHADDDGIVEAYPVMCMIGATEDDLKVLVSKEFVTVLNSDYVAYLNDWKENNNIRADRKVDSIYKELLLQVIPNAELKQSKETYYSRKRLSCQTNDRQVTAEDVTNDSIGKDRLGKDSIDNNIVSKDTIRSTDVQRIIDEWNKIGLSQVKKLSPNTSRYRLLRARIKEYGTESIVKAIRSITDSPFLMGQVGKGWTITFDWLVRPDNFPKVLGGNYLENGKASANQTEEASPEDIEAVRQYFLNEIEKERECH